MALHVLRKIAANISDRVLTIMVDETTDCSMVQQYVIAIWWVDEHLKPHKDFITTTTAPVSTSIFTRVLLISKFTCMD